MQQIMTPRNSMSNVLSLELSRELAYPLFTAFLFRQTGVFDVLRYLIGFAAPFLSPHPPVSRAESPDDRHKLSAKIIQLCTQY